MDAIAKTRVYLNEGRCDDLGIEYSMFSPEDENNVSLNVNVTLPTFLHVMYQLDAQQYENCTTIVVNAIKKHRHTIVFCPIANQPGWFYIF
jgi:hypothetical protein